MKNDRLIAIKEDVFNKMNNFYIDNERILDLKHDIGFYKGLLSGIVLSYSMFLLTKFYIWMFSI